MLYRVGSPSKGGSEDKGSEIKEDIIKIEETSEGDVNSLPLPEPMPLDEEGNSVETRIPLNLKTPGKSIKSSDFLLQSVRLKYIKSSFPHNNSIMYC